MLEPGDGVGGRTGHCDVGGVPGSLGCAALDRRRRPVLGLLPHPHVGLGGVEQGRQVGVGHPDPVQLLHEVRKHADIAHTVEADVKGVVPDAHAIEPGLGAEGGNG